jgi:hypothetical protein
MINEQVISMPDKWEYPWYAAWDLAFHTLALSTVDPKFAKDQLELLLHQLYLHPKAPGVMELFKLRLQQMPELHDSLHHLGRDHLGMNQRGLIALVNEKRLRRVLSRMLDENEFLGPYGLRAISRYHAERPYVFRVGGEEYRVDYVSAESNTGLFGGNSNWRGPVWMPVNVLVIRALWQFYMYYGDNFRVECPTGSGQPMNLFEVAQEITRRLKSIFLRDSSGRRPVYGGMQKFQTDPHWRDHILFHEYFHGDNGAGLGASHQTGWTGAIAKLIELFGSVDAESLLREGKSNG